MFSSLIGINHCCLCINFNAVFFRLQIHETNNSYKDLLIILYENVINGNRKTGTGDNAPSVKRVGRRMAISFFV